MYTIDHITAVREVFAFVGFTGSLKVAESTRADEITFVLPPKELIRLTTVGNVSDLEHIVQVILRVRVMIEAESPEFGALRNFDMDTAAPAAERDSGSSRNTSTEVISLDEGYRAAYFLLSAYIELEKAPGEDLILLYDYLVSDPARWGDWLSSVERARADTTAASEYLHDWRWKFNAPEGHAGP